MHIELRGPKRSLRGLATRSHDIACVGLQEMLRNLAGHWMKHMTQELDWDCFEAFLEIQVELLSAWLHMLEDAIYNTLGNCELYVKYDPLF